MEPDPVIVTLRDVWLEVREVRTSVAVLPAQTATLADHETRLRGLERWRYALPASLALAMGSSVVAVAAVIVR